MSRARVLALLLVSSAAAWIWGCETDAVAVEDCREIEQARCRAAQYCDFGIDSDEDVADCERFARDHCLHGFQVDEGPGGTALRHCVEAIEAARNCVRMFGADAVVSACPTTPTPLAGPSPATMVCDAVQDPETLTACAFLVPEPEEPPPPPPEDAATAADAPTD